MLRPKRLKIGNRRSSAFSNDLTEMRTSIRTPDVPTKKIKASSAKIGLYEGLASSRDKAFLLLTTHKNEPNVLAYYQKVLQHIEAAQDLLSLKLLTPSELKELSTRK